MSKRLAPSFHSRSLPFIFAFMTILAGLALSALTGLQTLDRIWAQQSPNTATIELPPDLPDLPTQTHALLDLLHHTTGVTHVHQYTPEETQTLLAPWLDQNSNSTTPQIPTTALPLIITAEHTADVTLEATITAHFPHAVLEENGHWTERLKTIIAALTHCAAFILIITLGTTSLTTALVIRHAVTTQRNNLTILHGLGSAPMTLANRMAVHAATLGFLGSLLGLLLLFPTLTTLSDALSPLVLTGAEAPTNTAAFLNPSQYANLLSPRFWPILCLPLFCGAVAWTTTQCVILTWLRRLP